MVTGERILESLVRCWCNQNHVKLVKMEVKESDSAEGGKITMSKGKEGKKK